MIGVEIRPESGMARPFCEALKERRLLCNDTHHHTIRIAPPLVIERETLEGALPIFEAVLSPGVVV
jgi:ornithine--oxo-acid transaminase